MYIVIVYFPGCDVIHFEEIKKTFIVFKGLSLKQTKQTFLEHFLGDTPTLKNILETTQKISATQSVLTALDFLSTSEIKRRKINT